MCVLNVMTPVRIAWATTCLAFLIYSCLSRTGADFTLGFIRRLGRNLHGLKQKEKWQKKERRNVASCGEACFTNSPVGIPAWKTSVVWKHTYWDGPKIPCFLIFDALLEERHWWGVCLCCLCWSLAHRALWERASETWPQTFSWSPQNKTGKSWQSVRHWVVTQSVAGNQSLNSSDSSLHHAQCQYTAHKDALSSSLSLSLSFSICLNPFPPSVVSRAA